MKLDKKQSLLQKRRWRIRKKVKGTAERPRLAVRSPTSTSMLSHRRLKGHTMVYVSSTAKDSEAKANSEGAIALGKLVAEKAKAAGIESVVFDRSGRRYHGCVKSFADAAREGGLQF